MCQELKIIIHFKTNFSIMGKEFDFEAFKELAIEQMYASKPLTGTVVREFIKCSPRAGRWMHILMIRSAIWIIAIMVIHPNKSRVQSEN